MTAEPSNRCIVLATSPRGLPVTSDFRLESVAVQQPGDR
jgi:NADPH-dependent curcumin reductase CurA